MPKQQVARVIYMLGLSTFHKTFKLFLFLPDLLTLLLCLLLSHWQLKINLKPTCAKYVFYFVFSLCFHIRFCYISEGKTFCSSMSRTVTKGGYFIKVIGREGGFPLKMFVNIWRIMRLSDVGFYKLGSVLLELDTAGLEKNKSYAKSSLCLAMSILIEYCAYGKQFLSHFVWIKRNTITFKLGLKSMFLQIITCLCILVHKNST